MSKNRMLDIAAVLLVLVTSVHLRGDLQYRTAFLDETINMYDGWRFLAGYGTEAITFHMGWFPFSYVPLGLAGWWGGVELARAVNVLWGLLTIVLVLLTARGLYGRLAGYTAAGIFAVYGPAIDIHTLATYDSLSVLFAGVALFLWLKAWQRSSTLLGAAGTLAMTLSVLTKYTAGLLAAPVALYILAVGLRRSFLTDDSTGDTLLIHPRLDRIRNVALVLSPFLIIVVFLAVFRNQLAQLLQLQILTKRITEPNVEWAIVSAFAGYLGVPALLALPALVSPKHRIATVGLMLVAMSMVPYHLLNKDNTTLFKHSCYMLLGLAPLAAGGVVAIGPWLQDRLGLRPREDLAVRCVLGLMAITILGILGQQILPGLRSYWPDTTQTMAYLRTQIEEGDSVLMEGGWVGRYYLIQKGEPGHRPAEVVETWHFADEVGFGTEAYERAIVAQRFDWIILDDQLTPELNDRLRSLIPGRYQLVAVFPARVYGYQGQIEIFKAVL